MIDLHLHLLPGIDDGAGSTEDSVAMCRIAREAGSTVLVATPHQRHASWQNQDSARLRELIESVQAEVGSSPRLLSGAEIRVDDTLLTELAGRDHSGLLSLAGSRYLLLELDRHGFGPDPMPLAHELRVDGWRPIFAHPEFAPQLADLETVAELVRGGVLFQITAMSLTGDFGPGPQAYCRDLLDLDLVHFVASDGHGTSWRPPQLERAYEELASGWGEERARHLTEENPRSVIEDREIEP